MKIQLFRCFAPIALLVTVLPCLLFFSACEEDDQIACPNYQIGVVQGYVTAAGQGISVELGARGFDENNYSNEVFTTRSDSTGWYSLEVPIGLYRLELDPRRSAYYYTRSLEDTVRVSTGIQQYDFPRGRTEVRLTMPMETEGQLFSLSLDNSSSITPRSQGTVQEGELLFVFPAHPPGTYRMKFSGLNYSQFYLPGSREEAEADTVVVGTSSVAKYEADFSSSYASIEGSVTGSWIQASSGGMQVNAVSEDGYRVGYVYCEPDGYFKCGFLYPQTVHLETTYNNAFRQFVGGNSRDTARRFALEPGDRITGVDVVENGISVHLRGPGELIYHTAKVRLVDEAETMLIEWTYRESDFYLCNLSPGRYFLHVTGHCEDQIWSPQWLGGSEDFALAQPIDLVEGELREVTFDLVEGGRLEGEIKEADGSSTLWPRYSLFGSDFNQVCSGSGATGDGRMLFRGLPNGTYYAAAIGGTGILWFYPGTEDISQATPIVITESEAVTGIVWSFPPELEGKTP